MGKAFPQFDRKVLVDWQKKGYLLKIRNGWYAFTVKERQTKDLFWIANRLYSPSFVSLLPALSFHGLNQKIGVSAPEELRAKLLAVCEEVRFDELAKDVEPYLYCRALGFVHPGYLALTSLA